MRGKKSKINRKTKNVNWNLNWFCSGDVGSYVRAVRTPNHFPSWYFCVSSCYTLHIVFICSRYIRTRVCVGSAESVSLFCFWLTASSSPNFLQKKPKRDVSSACSGLSSRCIPTKHDINLDMQIFSVATRIDSDRVRVRKNTECERGGRQHRHQINAYDFYYIYAVWFFIFFSEFIYVLRQRASSCCAQKPYKCKWRIHCVSQTDRKVPEPILNGLLCTHFISIDFWIHVCILIFE